MHMPMDPPACLWGFLYKFLDLPKAIDLKICSTWRLTEDELVGTYAAMDLVLKESCLVVMPLSPPSQHAQTAASVNVVFLLCPLQQPI